MYKPNNRASNYIRKKKNLKELQREKDKFTIIGNFNFHSSEINKSHTPKNQ